MQPGFGVHTKPSTVDAPTTTGLGAGNPASSRLREGEKNDMAGVDMAGIERRVQDSRGRELEQGGKSQVLEHNRHYLELYLILYYL